MNEKMNEALNEIRDEYIDEAAKAKKRRRPYWFGAVAAVLAIAVIVGVFWNPGSSAALVNCVAAAEYPEMAQKPNPNKYLNDDKYFEDLTVWRENQAAQYDQPEGYADSLTPFFAASIAEFLSGDENQAYSPLNVYMAMAMLAETTDGNSRQQILELFGADSIEALREQAGHVWNAHYCDDGEATSILASSVWLDEAYPFHQNTMDILAESYYASAFHGDLGSKSMNKQMQTWLNEQTGGLLEDQIENLELDTRTVFALASTVYFKAGWSNEFSKNRTEEGIFHAKDGDITADFMHSGSSGTYYWADNFSAISLSLDGQNKMWLVLPDEGYSVSDILASDEYLRLSLAPYEWKNQQGCIINLSLPKFDISSQMDLIDGMKNLGLTDIFDPGISDFTPMTDTPELYVNMINHAARVKINEEGVEAAAYTVLGIVGSGAPPDDEIDFVLDRPFLFIISSRDNLPLFAGTVAEP